MKARVILADPPWEYNNRRAVREDGKKPKGGVGVASRYSHGVMNHKDISSLPISRISHDDCLLFMWTTWTHIQEAVEVIHSWGFQYSTCAFVWVKTTQKSGDFFTGPGRYTFSNSEPCLLARKGGRLWHPNTGWRPSQIVMCPHPIDENKKIIHSRKPSVVHEHIEKWLFPHMGSDAYALELFATQRRRGWVTLGGAIDNLDIRLRLEEIQNGLLLEE